MLDSVDEGRKARSPKRLWWQSQVALRHMQEPSSPNEVKALPSELEKIWKN